MQKQVLPWIKVKMLRRGNLFQKQKQLYLMHTKAMHAPPPPVPPLSLTHARTHTHAERGMLKWNLLPTIFSMLPEVSRNCFFLLFIYYNIFIFSKMHFIRMLYI